MNQIFQRLSSVFLYTLPLKASIPFGYDLFSKYSYLNVLKIISFPVAIIEESIPLGGLLFFVILFAGLVRNPNVPYFVRYNACQALLIDIALIIISYLLRIFPIGTDAFNGKVYKNTDEILWNIWFNILIKFITLTLTKFFLS